MACSDTLAEEARRLVKEARRKAPDLSFSDWRFLHELADALDASAAQIVELREALERELDLHEGILAQRETPSRQTADLIASIRVVLSAAGTEAERKEEEGGTSAVASVPVVEFGEVWTAALAEDVGGLIVALDPLPEAELDRVIDAAQLLDKEGQDAYERLEASTVEPKQPGRGNT